MIRDVPSSPALVTLVRPTRVSSAGNWSNPVTPPLGLAYLAGMLRANGTNVNVVDGIGEAIDQIVEHDAYTFQGLTIDETVARIDPDSTLIGVSAMFTQDWLWMSRLLRAIRERFPDTLIVAGGSTSRRYPK